MCRLVLRAFWRVRAQWNPMANAAWPFVVTSRRLRCSEAIGTSRPSVGRACIWPRRLLSAPDSAAATRMQHAPKIAFASAASPSGCCRPLWRSPRTTLTVSVNCAPRLHVSKTRQAIEKVGSSANEPRFSAKSAGAFPVREMIPMTLYERVPISPPGIEHDLGSPVGAIGTSG